jgi:hypothetical protein
MKLNVIAFALAAGIFWGGAVLLVALADLVWPGDGWAILEIAASIYPGFQPGGGAGAVLLGTLYALADGAISGAVFAWLYNLLARLRPGAAR